jgi:hypothetical protein
MPRWWASTLPLLRSRVVRVNIMHGPVLRSSKQAFVFHLFVVLCESEFKARTTPRCITQGRPFSLFLGKQGRAPSARRPSPVARPAHTARLDANLQY